MTTFQMLPPIALPRDDIPVDATYGAGGINLQALAATIPSTAPEIPLTNSQVEGIGWDIAVFPEKKDQIMAHYGLDGEQWVQLQKMPVFMAGVKHAMAALKIDPNLSSRIVARNAMSDAVRVASDLARSTLVEPKDRLNAVKLLADIVQMGDTGAGAENRRAGKASGVGGGITINFGNVVGQALRQVIVERDQ